MNDLDKKEMVELYFLLDDSTWTTDIIHIPKSVIGDTPKDNEKTIIDWIYKNVKLHTSVRRVGIYSFDNK